MLLWGFFQCASNNFADACMLLTSFMIDMFYIYQMNEMQVFVAFRRHYFTL